MITSLYAIPLAIIYLVLTARVITYRRGNQISLGDAGDKSLLKRMRAQANCAENAPLGLLLMLLVELGSGSALALHGIGGLLVVGRALHGYGFSASPPIMGLRVSGMILTLLSFIVSILCLVGLAVTGS